MRLCGYKYRRTQSQSGMGTASTQSQSGMGTASSRSNWSCCFAKWHSWGELSVSSHGIWKFMWVHTQMSDMCSSENCCRSIHTYIRYTYVVQLLVLTQWGKNICSKRYGMGTKKMSSICQRARHLCKICMILWKPSMSDPCKFSWGLENGGYAVVARANSKAQVKI